MAAGPQEARWGLLAIASLSPPGQFVTRAGSCEILEPGSVLRSAGRQRGRGPLLDGVRLQGNTFRCSEGREPTQVDNLPVCPPGGLRRQAFAGALYPSTVGGSRRRVPGCGPTWTGPAARVFPYDPRTPRSCKPRSRIILVRLWRCMPSRSAASRWFPLDSASALRISRTFSWRTCSARDATDAAAPPAGGGPQTSLPGGCWRGWIGAGGAMTMAGVGRLQEERPGF